MPYLIDGHNLIGRTPGLSLADPDDERKLVELLRAFMVRTRKKGTVVFDNGQPGSSSTLSNSVLEVVFARASRSADDLIRQRLATERNPRGLVVVSGDLELARAAQAARARWQDSAEFARELLKRSSTLQKKESALTEKEVLAWEEEFRRGRS
jgi:predicted RNA-binding protein with PIN domain